VSEFKVEQMSASTQTLYSSSNGDTWFLETSDVGPCFVLHQANAAAGGTKTRLPVKEFLERAGAGPEREAVIRMMAEFPPLDEKAMDHVIRNCSA